jgi:hypothetical protein
MYIFPALNLGLFKRRTIFLLKPVTEVLLGVYINVVVGNRLRFDNVEFVCLM